MILGPPLDSSDHRTVYLFGSRSKNKFQKIVKLWDFRRSNIERFMYLLSITDFSFMLECNCVNEAWRIFYECLYTAISFMPSDYVILTSSDKPWITPLLKSLITKRWKTY